MLACKESCIPVNKEFTARLGRGVPIGELDLTPIRPRPERIRAVDFPT